MFIYFWERNRVRVGEGQKEGETQNPKQAPGCEHRAQCGALTHEPWDHDLSQSQIMTWAKVRHLNWLKHPGTPRANHLRMWLRLGLLMLWLIRFYLCQVERTEWHPWGLYIHLFIIFRMSERKLHRFFNFLDLVVQPPQHQHRFPGGDFPTFITVTKGSVSSVSTHMTASPCGWAGPRSLLRADPCLQRRECWRSVLSPQM